MGNETIFSGCKMAYIVVLFFKQPYVSSFRQVLQSQLTDKFISIVIYTY